MLLVEKAMAKLKGSYSKFTNYRHDAQLGSKSSFLAIFEGENEFLRQKNIIERRDDN